MKMSQAFVQKIFWIILHLVVLVIGLCFTHPQSTSGRLWKNVCSFSFNQCFVDIDCIEGRGRWEGGSLPAPEL